MGGATGVYKFLTSKIEKKNFNYLAIADDRSLQNIFDAVDTCQHP
jgi:hypothetical protein